jgi:preprotein translocase subunit YajC
MVCTEWSSFLPAVLGTAQAVQKQSPISAVVSFLPMFVGIMLIFYFMIYRPQQKKQKEAEAMISSISKGDKVITIGGIHGTIVEVKNNIAVVKIAENVKIEINKSAIATAEKRKE